MLNFERDDRDQGDHSPTQADQEPIANPPAPGAKKKPRSEKQREASRRNGSLGHGPHDTTWTRHNALKHGLTAVGLTKLDDLEEYEHTVVALSAAYPSTNPFSRFLVGKAALDMTRSHRVARHEAENVTALSSSSAASSDPSHDTPSIDPMVMKEYGGPIFDTLQRQDSHLMNNLVRSRRELERIKQEEEDSVGNDSDQ